jgi:hypothetical protein
MAVNSVSPGSYNSPSVQPQTQQAQRAPEKTREAKPEENSPPPPRTAEHANPTVNTSGQTVGRIVNTKA